MNAAQQLALGLEPVHHNQYLFSDHYLNYLLPGDPRWAEALPQAESDGQLQTRLQATDHLIDQLVYKLYGLTEDEIAIVEEHAP